MKYSLIAPAYNEVGNVELLIQKLAENMEKVEGDYEIVIVDDGSDDGTFEKLKELCDKYPQLVAVSLAQNSGQTIAFQAGFDHARGERILTLDADLEKDPAFIPAMAEKMNKENLDVVYFKKMYQDVGFVRKYASRVANKFRRAVTGDKAKDVGSTFVLYSKNYFKGRNFCSGFHRYFIGFGEVEGLQMDYVEGPVYNRPTGITKYTTWGRLKQGMMDMFYYYLYKNPKVSVHKFIAAMLAVYLVTLFAPLGDGVKTAAYAALGILAALLISLNLHATHLLTQKQRRPYQIKEIWPSR